MAFQVFYKHFNGTAISTSFVLPRAAVHCDIFILVLNNLKSVKLSSG